METKYSCGDRNMIKFITSYLRHKSNKIETICEDTTKQKPTDQFQYSRQIKI